MKFIFSVILSGYLYAGLVDNSMSVYYIPFSHLSRFGGLYTLDAIQYNNILFTMHGVDDIPNTLEAWPNISPDGPKASEIDYSKINYFDAKDYDIILSKIIKNRYNLLIKSTFSRIYNRNGIGLGLNIITTKRKFRWFDYYLGIYDIFSFKTWLRTNSYFSSEGGDGYNEIYEPKLMFSLEKKILKSLNVLTLYGMYKDSNGESIVDYRLGSKINLTNNATIYFGKSSVSKIALGFSISNNLFTLDYSYILSNDDLPFEDSYNIGISINILKLSEKGKEFYP